MLLFLKKSVLILLTSIGLIGVPAIPPNSTPEVLESTEPSLTATSTVNSEFEAIKAKLIPPLLEKIAFCESGGKQFNSDGSIIKGIVNPQDLGKFQINEQYWGSLAEELGYNLFSLSGNTDMALYIYDKYGTTPWIASIKCWGKNPDYRH